MTNEELQQQIEQLEQQIKDLKVKLEESKSEKKPYEVKVPEDIDDYVYINNAGNTFDLNTFTIVGFEEIFKRGLAFKTEEEAKQYDKERILLFKLHNWAEEHNGDWFTDWQNGAPKYFAMFNRFTGEFSVGADCYCRVFTKLPYFKSEEIARKFIKEFGDEIIEVLC